MNVDMIVNVVDVLSQSKATNDRDDWTLEITKRFRDGTFDAQDAHEIAVMIGNEGAASQIFAAAQSAAA